MKIIFLSPCLLLTGVCFASPDLVSGKGLPYSGKSSGAQNPFIHKVEKIGDEDWASKGQISSYAGEAFKGSAGDKEKSDTDKSYGESLGSSFDKLSKGESSLSDPSRGGASFGDPSAKDLSEMGGFAPPGSYTGTKNR
ncbi:MAG: hypothetical protein QM706_15900 [Nitrospira sp.]